MGNERNTKDIKIVIIGVGPVGLATAVGFASVGYNVTCFDINKKRIEALKDGKVPIYETELEKYINDNRERLFFSDDAKESLSNSDFIFIAVGTPIGKENSVDMMAFWSSVKTIADNITKECYVVIKSTVPIGTNHKAKIFFSDLDMPYKVSIISNPEFLAQGTSVRDTLFASRIVIGANKKEEGLSLMGLYQEFTCEKILTTPRSAEIIKYASNSYLAMRIAFINDISVACGLVGADIESVIKGISLDPRIGSKYLYPGLGYGGSCFPKDTVAFHNQIQTEFGHELELVQATIDINKRQGLYLCRKIIEDYKDLHNRSITLLGLSFKPGTDDIRSSVAIENAKFLRNKGADLTVWDPVAMQNAQEILGKSVRYAMSLSEAISASDIILIATEWQEIIKVQFDLLKDKHVYDGKNCLLKRKEHINFRYTYVGGILSHFKDEK